MGLGEVVLVGLMARVRGVGGERVGDESVLNGVKTYL